MLRDLRHADGGFFSAEDADSEGVEGKFYLWSLDELEQVVRRRRARGRPLLRRDRGRQLRGPAHRLPRQHPARRRPRPRSGRRRCGGRCRAVRARASRGCAPGSTTRCCSAGTRCSSGRWPRRRPRSTATTGWTRRAPNARFLLTELRRDDGRLLRSWQDGRARHLAYAEDYAALLEALLTLAEVDDVAWLADARCGRRRAARLFHDDEGGGFFTTGTDAEALIVRPKDFQDNATPSENSLAADGLLRLAALTGERRYEVAGRRGAPAARPGARRAPDRVRVPARRARAVGHAADRGRDRRRRRTPRPRSGARCSAGCCRRR